MSLTEEITHESSRGERVDLDEAIEWPPEVVLLPVISEPTVKEELIVLLPALDEEDGVAGVIDAIPLDTLEQMGCEVTVLVVDGASKDATCEVARRKGARVFVQSGRGKGTGVRQAFDHLLEPHALEDGFPRRRHVVMLDADGTYPAEDLPRFLDLLRAGYDVVIGSRFLGHIEEGAMTALNRIGNRALSRLARALYRVPVTDVCTGMWGLSQDFLERCSLQAEGFELEAEIFAEAVRAKARITELPITYRPRVGAAKLVPLRTGLKIARWLLRERIGAKKTPSVALETRTMERFSSWS